MPKRSTKPPPTEEEIMRHNNVPLPVAALYIGWSSCTIRYALQQGRAPFGCAAQDPESGRWSYNISPGLLIRYKAGDLPYFKLNDLLNMATDKIQEVLDLRIEAAAQLMRGGKMA